MPSKAWKIVPLALILAALACTLPGTASPTPFVFPTPNQTLTAIYRPTETPSAAATSQPNSTATEVPLEETANPTATTSITEIPDGQSRPNGPLISAPLLPSPPTIDADLSDWPDQRWSATEVVFGSGQWSSGSDLSASFAVAWDENNLYLAATVNDDAHVQAANGYYLYQGDSLEILLDTALDSDFYTTTLSADDYQVGLSPGDFNSRGTQAYRWFPRSVQASLSSPTIAASATSDGYLVEASLPWVIFGVEPAENDLFGFAFSVSDNDAAGTTLQQSMVSSVSTRVLTNPATWGTLRLAGDSD